MKKRRLMLIIGIFLLGISTVYAVTIIRAVDVTYDNSKSNGNSTNVQGAIDELYSLSDGSCSSGSSTTRGTNLIEYITKLAESDTTNLVYDDTVDKNLRYIGSNPNNYVRFNDELWRIIGVMNNVKDANGNSSSMIKLYRFESIGSFSFDNQGTSGINDWSQSRLMTTLNDGSYWNRTSGTCYNGQNNQTKECDFSKSGLKEESKKLINNVEWNLGALTSAQNKASIFYTYERSTLVPISNAKSWIGYVGLMYPSDFGYAVGGDARTSCLALNLNNYNNQTNSCYFNTWFNQISHSWTITPVAETSLKKNDLAYTLFSGSKIDSSNLYQSRSIHPVVYLNTDVRKISGSGTSGDPYIITNNAFNSSNSTNISSPKLDSEGKLIPITLANDGTAIYTQEDNASWYDYKEKKWANAVILVDSPSTNYKVGDVIKESDIESYFVWIPKYKYKLWNVESMEESENSPVHEIDIVFDTNDTKDEEGISCKTPMTSGETGNCNNGEYMTHPAFISLGVDGFWVGKFETGYKGASSTAAAQVTSNDSSKIIIKPNVYSWRNNTVYNFFVSAYNYERDLDSHMMKNTEWGAVAYLSHSKYGINGEININNNSSYKTGYSALKTTDQSKYPGVSGNGTSYNQTYNMDIGYLASTTGNITGVYDMSGGAYEFMASYVGGQLGKSGFTATTIKNYNTKYFDVYNASSTNITFQYKILGDATGEMGPFQNYKDGDGGILEHNSWYADMSIFLHSSYPWFLRGGRYYEGLLAGQFSFSTADGSINDSIGIRIVLSP